MPQPIVLQLSRRISSRSEVAETANVGLRTFAGQDDIEPWLALRKAAFADLKKGVREWQRADFQAGFLQANWWSPERMWLAFDRETLVGTATLGTRGTGHNAKPVIHWMMVHPQWQRQGIGRQLVAKLETQAWDQGYRQVYLETHASWLSAVAFYESLGYQSESSRT